MSDHIIVTIDGPAGVGKSSVARSLAQHLNVSFLDTGAMYRALTLKAMKSEVNLDSEDDLVALAQDTSVQLHYNHDEGLTVSLDGEDVSQDIRREEVTNKTHHVSSFARVREIMVDWQRQIGQAQSIVGEGRDLGTVVFPQAQFKFFLEADFEIRAQRRIKQLKEQGQEVDEAQLKADLETRDTRDSTRDVSPLKKADDAIVIECSDMTVQDTVDAMLEHIQAKN